MAVLCFDTPVGRSDKLLLLSMSAINLSGINVNYHIDESFEGTCVPLKFKIELKPTGNTHSRAETYYYKIDKGDLTPCDVYRNTTLHDEDDNIVLMTLRGRVDWIKTRARVRVRREKR
jgi:hypothetical protein